MVKIVKVEPHPSVIKQCVCKNCGATLEYTPQDILRRTVRDYGGGSDTYNYISCPNCNKEVTIYPWKYL
jgi:RNase P subunit RPR2